MARKNYVNSYRPWRLKPAPKVRCMVGIPAKVKPVYEACHLAWRAGIVTDFYYGARSPIDPTIVWVIDGTEYAKDAAGEVAQVIAATRDAAGIASLAFGETWCGYRAVIVTYTDGSRVCERWNGTAVEVTDSRQEVAA